MTVSVTLDALANLVRAFVADGGVQNALLAHLEAGKASAARGNTNAANNALTAFQNHVSAQSDNAVPAARAATLMSLAEALKR